MSDTSRSRFSTFLERWRAGKLPAYGSKHGPVEDVPPPSNDPVRRARDLKRYRDWLWPRRWSLALIIGLIGGIFPGLRASRQRPLLALAT